MVEMCRWNLFYLLKRFAKNLVSYVCQIRSTKILESSGLRQLVFWIWANSVTIKKAGLHFFYSIVLQQQADWSYNLFKNSKCTKKSGLHFFTVLFCNNKLIKAITFLRIVSVASISNWQYFFMQWVYLISVLQPFQFVI